MPIFAAILCALTIQSLGKTPLSTVTATASQLKSAASLASKVLSAPPEKAMIILLSLRYFLILFKLISKSIFNTQKIK